MPGRFAPAYLATALVRIHELIALGFRRIKSRDLRETQEEGITALLIAAIRDLLDSNDAPHWGRHFSVHEELPVTSESLLGRTRPRVDIVMELVTHRPRPRIPFEAKRLYRGDSVAEYVGPDGLGRLILATYPAPVGACGMIGYVQNGTNVEWIERIEAKLCLVRREVGIVGVETPVMVSTPLCVGLPDTRRTIHTNARGELRVFHNFLNTCSDLSPDRLPEGESSNGMERHLPETNR
jgi:hypothetical protein